MSEKLQIDSRYLPRPRGLIPALVVAFSVIAGALVVARSIGSRPLLSVETKEPPLATVGTLSDVVGGPFRPRPPKPPDPAPQPLPEPETGDFSPRERVLFGRVRELVDAANSRAEQRESRRDARTAAQIEEALTEVSQYDPEKIQAGGFWATVAAKLWEWIRTAVTKIVETVMKAKAIDFQVAFLKQYGWQILGALVGLYATLLGAKWGATKLVAKAKGT